MTNEIAIRHGGVGLVLFSLGIILFTMGIITLVDLLLVILSNRRYEKIQAVVSKSGEESDGSFKYKYEYRLNGKLYTSAEFDSKKDDLEGSPDKAVIYVNPDDPGKFNTKGSANNYILKNLLKSLILLAIGFLLIYAVVIIA